MQVEEKADGGSALGMPIIFCKALMHDFKLPVDRAIPCSIACMGAALAFETSSSYT